MAAIDDESIRSEIAFRVSRSSGPGGQHAQKSSTRVEALFDVEASEGLSEGERRRVLDKLGCVKSMRLGHSHSRVNGFVNRRMP